MNKILLGLVFLSVQFLSYSQSFNNGTILKKGHFSGGVNPIVMNKVYGAYLHCGYGITRNTDFNFKYGFFDGVDYVGADLEWSLRRTNRMDASLVTGVHSMGDMGIDIGLVASFPLSSSARIISGLDSDFNFNLNNDLFIWIPIGLEFDLAKNSVLIIEGDLPLTEFAPGIFGGGVIIYFD